MANKRKRIIFDYVLPLSILVLFLLFCFFFYLEIIIPSYYSYLAVCKPADFSDTGFVVAGIAYTQINETTGEKDVIIEVYYDDEYDTTLKHELIHKRQALRRFSFVNSCSNPIGKILTEVEAYTFERLPNPIFEFIYRFDLDDYR